MRTLNGKRWQFHLHRDVTFQMASAAWRRTWRKFWAVFTRRGNARGSGDSLTIESDTLDVCLRNWRSPETKPEAYRGNASGAPARPVLWILTGEIGEEARASQSVGRAALRRGIEIELGRALRGAGGAP